MKLLANNQGLKVLLVDSENKSRESIASELVSLGAEVTALAEFSRAEPLMEEGGYDLVVADVDSTGMKGLEGLELIPFVKTHCPKARVIVMDNDNSRSMLERAFRLGAEYFIHKPFDASVIGVIICALGF